MKQMDLFRRAIVAIVMALCMGFVTQAHDFEVDGIYYNITSTTDLTAEVTYKGSNYLYSNKYTGNVIIPESIIYNDFTYSITSIGSDAFFACSGLTSITIPNTVTNIDYEAFFGCSGLTSVTIPNSVTNIGYWAFYDCSGLTSITIPNSVTNIGIQAFYGCSGLTSVTIPNSVTKIGSYTFSGCSGLTSITIPNSVTSIGEQAFYGCSGLTSATIGNSVTNIDYQAFCGCSGLTSITIPNSVTNIGIQAFYGCSKLTSIEFNAENCTNNTGYTVFEGCSALSTVTIGENVKIIPDLAFSGCDKLTSTTIGNSVTSIGNGAFCGCSGLTSITIPNSVTSIGGSAFYGCSKLTSITIPNSVTNIGSSAFYWCSGLTSITIPNSVTNIGSSAFSGCSKLTSIVVESGNTIYDSRDNCNAIINTSTSTLIVGCNTTVIPNSVTSIGDNAFKECFGLTSITIPNSVTNIGSSAFYWCYQLSSISCYAMEPPTVGSWSFHDIAEDAVLYVLPPAVSIYSEAKIWKNFTILPLTTDERSLEVSLPAGSEGKYKNMTLEITNIASGIKLKYVTTDRITYTFNGLTKNTAYKISLFTQQGKLLGEIPNVEIKEDDVKVAFESLLSLKDVVLTIKTPDGTDVTSSVAVTWFDEKNTYLTQGNTLQGQTAGTILGYKMELNQELGTVYRFPAQQSFTVTEENNAPVFTLSPIDTVTINGVIKEKDGGYMSGVTVAISQKLNGVHSKSLIVSTDTKGAFTAQVFNDITTISVSAPDYVTNAFSMVDFSKGADLGTIELKPITGAKIALSYTYTTSVKADETAEKQNWYSDYENISYSIYNETAGREITLFSAQNASIVLLEDVATGDLLRITATSKKNSFTPVTVTATILEDNTSSAEFDIKEQGGITATYTSTDNTSVVGILYNAKCELVKKYNYSASALSISNLADGNYTLITMGASEFFNSILKLSQLSAAGLVENTDYVRNDITVASGIISSVSNETIPEFDESKLYYTGTNTSFTVNKSSIVAGNYLTLKANIDFKSDYTSSVSNVRLVVDLPESCSFVDNSLMVGRKVASYMLDGSTLTAQLDKYSDQVRFCVIPTLGGTYQPNAFVVFDLNGKEVRQPIGSAYFTVSDLSISVPSLVTKTTIPVSGTAIGKSSVEIYDNDVLIGETTATAGGTWAATCELVEPYNLSNHSIYAKVTTPTGLLLQSETKECQYDMNVIQVKTVNMSFYNGWLRKNVEVTFDLQNSTVSESSYMFYTGTDITFIADFTNNNPEVVQNVVIRVYTDKNEWKKLPATYDEKLDKWVASQKFESNNLPVGVKVDFDAITEKVVDANLLTSNLLIFPNSLEKLQESNREFSELLSKYEEALASNDDATISNIIQQMINSIGFDKTDLESERLDDGSYQKLVLEAEVANDSLKDVYNNIINSSLYNNEILSQYMENVSIKSTENITPEELISKGFECINKTDGSSFYLLLNNNQWELVDFSTNLYITIDEKTEAIPLSPYSSDGDNWLEKVKRLSDTIKDLVSSIQGLLDNCVDRIYDANKINGELFKEAQKKYATRYLDGLSKSEIRALEKDMSKYAERIKKNDAVAQWIEQNFKQYMSGHTNASKIAGKAFSFFALIKDGIEAYNNISKLIKLKNDISAPCEEAKDEANNLKSEVKGWVNKAGAFYVFQLGTDIAELAGISGGIAALIPSGGTSSVAIGVSIAVLTANITASMIFENKYTNAYNNFYNRNRDLNKLCDNDDDDDDDENDDNNDDDPPYPRVDPIHDPSGYVYEAVESNRLQGVTATCYYKETVEDMYGDLHEQVVLWDAAEYAQENPLFTDENGMYRWDVPQGLWQVKFEKEGYQTTYSEWLPVPPPQLEVNIGMVQFAQPDVVAVRGYEEGIEIDFSKFMIAETLNTEFITVTRGEETIAGTIELLNAEDSLASKVKYVFSTPLINGDKVVLTVNKKVKSYADIMMENNFSQEFDITTKPAITIPEVIEVVYGKTAELTVQLTPAKSAAGKKITINNSSSIIASVNATEIEVDSVGMATITVSGELVGTAMLTFNVPSDDLTASVEVKVIRPEERTVNRTYDLQTGWNWISVNVKDKNTEDIPAMLEPIKASFTTITDGSSALSYDAQAGFTGELSSIVPEKSYKVRMNANAILSLTGKIDNTTISLAQGWNLIGYTPQGAQSVNDALNGVAAEAGDVIMGRDAFATYNGNTWVGSLEQMHPGLGYMYYSQSVKSFNYAQPAEDTSTPTATTAPTYENWSYNPYKHADNMAVIATLHDDGGNVIEPANCVVAAFAGEECRGIFNGSNDIVFLTVHGETKGEEITFRIVDKTNGKEYVSKSSVSFEDAILGSATEPYVIVCSELSGIDDAEYLYGTLIYPNPVAERLFIKAPADTIKIAILSASGKWMISKEINTNEGLDVSALSDGAYIITIECNEMKSTHKFIKNSHSAK